MEPKNVDILSAKFNLKKISIKYYDNRVGQNRSAEETDYPTPDLVNARDEFRDDLANCYYADDEDVRERFTINGFEITEKDSIKTLEIKGQMMNSHDYLTDVSGKIPLDEDQKDLKEKIDTLITELFEFIFNAKTSQGNLGDLPANAQQEDEMKDTDGSPQIKARVRQIQRQMAQGRMMAAVPTADVVVTNPTHIAVALKYELEEMEAPYVVAMGERLIAQKIKELAIKHNIPVIEDKPLARALFKMSEIGQMIPAKLYRAVAELLAYVYKTKGKVNL